MSDQPRPADVEAEIERRYVFERGGMSVLAYVSANVRKLALEYLDWRAAGGAHDSIRADLSAWEFSRFGGELFPAAREILLRAVLCEAFPGDLKAKALHTEANGWQEYVVEQWVRDHPRREGEGAMSYIDRIAVGTGLIPESRIGKWGTSPPEAT